MLNQLVQLLAKFIIV